MSTQAGTDGDFSPQILLDFLQSLTIIKRDKSKTRFDLNKISWAIQRCFKSTKNLTLLENGNLTSILSSIISKILNLKKEEISVEEIQEIVIDVFFEYGCQTEFVAYSLYKEDKEKLRQQRNLTPVIRQKFQESAQYFETPLQQFQFFDKYSRYSYEYGRRETWVETVKRAVDFLRELSRNMLPEWVYDKIFRYILTQKSMPSMRLLASAGEAARRNHIAIFNCSYLGIDSIDAFVEIMWLSMSGAGVGYSVEKKFVSKLPIVQIQRNESPVTYVVADSTEGWCDALRFGIAQWMDGKDVIFDYSMIRPAGAVLRTKGGRASGPAPLQKLMVLAKRVILSRQGEQLTPLNCHDLACEIGNASICGGSRRTALLALYDQGDSEMRHCKDGDFSIENPQRWNANNTEASSPEGFSIAEIQSIMADMNDGQRGEPGLLDRLAVKLTIPERRMFSDEMGLNPCGEVTLNSMQMCNLSMAIVRPDDTVDTLKDKVEIAAIIGTIQSMATDFKGLRPQWKENCDRERLLGVDLNGQLDNPLCRDPEVLAYLKHIAVQTNAYYADLMGINRSSAVTCVKPSGNSSVLLNCASGLHARWSQYYIRNVRVSVHSALFKVLRDAGVPYSPENGQTWENMTTAVIHFPVKSPDHSIFKKDWTALQQLEHWKLNKVYWTEHNPSSTIYYLQEEFQEVVEWVCENRNILGGLSFLPASDAKYDNMPYVEITKDEYTVLLASFPEIDFSKIYLYEDQDYTEVAQTLACMSGSCEI